MKLTEITSEDVLAGKLWILDAGQEGEANPTVKETIGFTGEDMGLISAVVRIADGSEQTFAFASEVADHLRKLALE